MKSETDKQETDNLTGQNNSVENHKMTTNAVADALIRLSEGAGICDRETARGLKSSKKKDILKSNEENSFGRFTREIVKAQKRKDL